MVRRSAPPSSRWVAKQWRSACGETPPAIAASRTQRQAAGDVGVGEAPAALGEEERLLGAVGDEHVAAALEIAAQGALRGLADRQQALLAALAHHPQPLALEVERAMSRLTISSQRRPQE